MTTTGDAPEESGQEFGWGLAPAHLVTRRQLRERGKSPGQSLVALMVGRRRGRRMVARLFDERVAPAKRVPTPAQLDAVGKATREHQLRAAERRGISRAQMSAPSDPAPAWEHEKEGNIMSTTTSQEPAADQPQLGVPTGHGQRMAYLLATVAVNQARHRDAKLAAAIEKAQDAGPEAVEEVLRATASGQARAEARLDATIPANNDMATVAALADALVWHTNSEAAADRLTEFTASYAEQWGVLIDPDEFQVTIDPHFDAVDAQEHAESLRLYEREASALDFISAMPLPGASKTMVSEAISRWRGDGSIPADPRAHLSSQAQRRDRLGADLSRLADADRARVGFVVDYLRGDTTQVDLLASPVYVDPGEEARGRVPRLLAAFADNPNAAKFVGGEIAVMTTADQDRVRQAGREIAAHREVDYALWPGYVDRYELGEAITDYAAEYGELRSTADYLAESGFNGEELAELGVDFGGRTDEINIAITRLAEQREQLRARIRDGEGLAPIERAQLAAVVDDIGAGHIRDHKHLPELLFADERSKNDADVVRIGKPAALLSAQTREAVTKILEAPGAIVETPATRAADRLDFEVSCLADSIYSVACGARGLGVEHERKSYRDKRDRLGQALNQANVGGGTQDTIRELIDDRARQAGKLGRAAAQREQQWKTKVDTTVAARNDAIAQRRAADAGRAPNPSGRGCTARPDRAAAKAETPVPAQAAGRHQLRGQEIGA